jgi:hypothetical protein
MYAALGMTPAAGHPHERSLPAGRGCRLAVDDNVFDFVDDATVADLTPEEFDVLSNDMAAAQADVVDDGAPDRGDLGRCRRSRRGDTQPHRVGLPHAAGSG